MHHFVPRSTLPPSYGSWYIRREGWAHGGVSPSVAAEVLKKSLISVFWGISLPRIFVEIYRTPCFQIGRGQNELVSKNFNGWECHAKPECTAGCFPPSVEWKGMEKGRERGCRDRKDPQLTCLTSLIIMGIRLVHSKT